MYMLVKIFSFLVPIEKISVLTCKGVAVYVYRDITLMQLKNLPTH